MVEIKRTRAGQGVTLNRIGVVNVQSGADKVQAQKAQEFAAFSDFAYKKAAELQVSAGEEAAKGAVTIDPATGEAKVTKVPQGYGKYGNKAMGDIIQKEYAIAAENDTRNTVKQLAADANNDPKEFQKLYGFWKEKRIKALKDSGGVEYVDDFDKMATMYGAGAYTDMRLAKQKATQERNQVLFRQNITVASREISTLYQAGLTGQADDLFKQTVDKLTSNTNLTVEQRANAIKNVEKVQQQSIVAGVVENMDSLAVEALTVEAQQGKWSKQTLKKYPILNKIKSLTSEEWSGIGSRLSTLKGSLVTQEKNVREAAETLGRVMVGAGTPEDAQKVFEVNKINNFAFITGSDSKAIDLVKQVGAYPETVLSQYSSMTKGGFIENPQAMLNLLDNFAALSVTETAYGQSQALRGMSQDTYDDMKMIESYVATNGRAAIAGAIANLNAPMNDADALDRMKKVAGSNFEKPNQIKSAAQAEMEMTRQILVNYDLPPTEIARISSFTRRASMIYDNFNDVKKAVLENIGRVYVKSDYVKGASRVNPERFYSDQVGLEVMRKTDGGFLNFIASGMRRQNIENASPFEEYVNGHVLSHAANLNDETYFIGKNGNAILVPIYSVSNSETAEWFVKDKRTLLPITDRNGSALKVTTKGMSHVTKHIELSNQRKTKLNQQRAIENRRLLEDEIKNTTFYDAVFYNLP